MADIHTTIIVADEDVAMARAIAAALSPAGYAEFRIPLRPVGDTGPATHWLTSGHIGEQFVELAQDGHELSRACDQLDLLYGLDELFDMIGRATIRPVAQTSALDLLHELKLEPVPPPEEK